MTQAKFLMPFFGLVLAFSPACVEEEGGGGDVDEEACMHLQDGSGAMAIVATADTSAPDQIMDNHSRYDVDLVPAGGTGFVFFSPPGPSTYVFFFTKAIPVQFQTTMGTPVTPTATASSSPACNDVMSRIEVTSDGTLLNVRLGPDGTPGPVGVVVEEDTSVAPE